MLRANMELVAGLVSLFGEAAPGEDAAGAPSVAGYDDTGEKLHAGGVNKANWKMFACMGILFKH